MAVIPQSYHILPASFGEERIEMCAELLCLASCRLECTKLTVAATLIFIAFVGCHHVKGRIRKLHTHTHTQTHTHKHTRTHCVALTHRLVGHDQN